MELATSKPDGYTVVISCTPQVPINAYVRETSYKISDFAFVANVVTDPGIFLVRAESPYKTMADVIKAAKEKPGTFSVGVSSAPGDDWFAMRMFEEAAQIKLNIVPFSGDGPSWQAALAGHVDATSNNLGTVYPQIRAGQLRALAIMTDKRSPIVPDVRTFKELGYNFTSGSSRGFTMPKNTPKAIIDVFAGAVKQVMNTEEFKANAIKTAYPSDYQGPEEYTTYMKNAGHDLSTPLGQIRKITGRRCAKGKIASLGTGKAVQAFPARSFTGDCAHFHAPCTMSVVNMHGSAFLWGSVFQQERYSREDRFGSVRGIDPCGRSGL